MIQKIFDAEMKLVKIVWANEPLSSKELIALCSEQLGWNKSTTYTVLRKLCERGILRNEQSTVTSIAKKTDVQQYESKTVMERSFDDSLPQFITAFMNDKTLSRKEAEELKNLIDQYTSDSDNN